MRRTAVAFLVSLGLHATVLLAALALSWGRALVPDVHVDVVPVTLQEVKELPVGRGPRARKPRAKRDEPTKSKPGPAPHVNEAAAPAPGEEGQGGAAKPAAGPGAQPSPETQPAAEPERRGDVSAYGPEGSRLIAILRLDRLRSVEDAPAYATALDGLLRLLPDRRLLDETKVDLYRDFDALLVATPNPLDDAATFLAARHRLREDELRAALSRGAKASGFTVKWRKERGRWVGVRKSQKGGAAPERDDRLLLMPAPGLVVIAAPAYAKLLLDASPAGGGSAKKSGSSEEEHGDGGWAELVARIDAEDGAVPEDAVFVLTATNLLTNGAVAAGAKVEMEGRTVAPLGPVKANEICVLMGALPAPFLEIRAEFEGESDARLLEAQWPAWKRNLLANPVVLLARADQLLSNAHLGRDGSTVVLRTNTTSEDMLRLLRIAGSLAASGKDVRPPR